MKLGSERSDADNQEPGCQRNQRHGGQRDSPPARSGVAHEHHDRYDISPEPKERPSREKRGRAQRAPAGTEWGMGPPRVPAAGLGAAGPVTD